MYLSESERRRLRARYGDWALVSGASSGIGRALALALAEAGFHLVLTARRNAELQFLSTEIRAHHAVNTQIVVADLSTREGVNQVIEQTEHRPIGLVIAAAGYGTSGALTAQSLEAEWNMLDLNAGATLALAWHFGRKFQQKKRGGLVLLSSMLAFQGVKFSANYAATKAYVQTLSEGLAQELRPFGVDVLAAAPGPVVSGFGDRANMKMGMGLTPEQVATPILEALGRSSTVVPGWLSKVLTYSLRTAPRWGRTLILSQIMSGFTQHQRT